MFLCLLPILSLFLFCLFRFTPRSTAVPSGLLTNLVRRTTVSTKNLPAASCSSGVLFVGVTPGIPSSKALPPPALSIFNSCCTLTCFPSSDVISFSVARSSLNCAKPSLSNSMSSCTSVRFSSLIFGNLSRVSAISLFCRSSFASSSFMSPKAIWRSSINLPNASSSAFNSSANLNDSAASSSAIRFALAASSAIRAASSSAIRFASAASSASASFLLILSLILRLSSNDLFCALVKSGNFAMMSSSSLACKIRCASSSPI